MKRMFFFFVTLWMVSMGASAQKYHYDVTNDGSVNITDAVAVINKILGKDNPGDVESGEAVDLGLPSGTKWASWNVGASKPEEYGGYYAWGETEEKSEYTESNYLYYQNGNYVDIGSNISGTEYDVAHVKWGVDWVMPTWEDMDELLNNCTTEWTTLNGVNGMKFTSNINGKSIFFPATGERNDVYLHYAGSTGYCWSSSRYQWGPNDAYYFYYDSSSAGRSNMPRFLGRSVRPVKKTNTLDVPAEAIDLGLPSGTMWASYNIGATSPEEYGGYYAWGETEEKEVYDWSTYIHCDGSKETCHDLGSDIGGTEYDVAHVKWGGDWRMPTFDEFQELIDNCDYEWITYQGVQGGKFTGPNGNSIFLPVAGVHTESGLEEVGLNGYYWSSMHFVPSSGSNYLYLSSSVYFCDDWLFRSYGQCVRPVRPSKNSVPAMAVDLGLPSGTMWASHNVGASSPEECGNYYAWGETEVKNEYGFETYTHIDGYESLCKDIGSNISGTKYDVAHVKWGGNWRMPTEDEVDELFENCSFKWTRYNGVDGGLFTGPNGNSVFLPAGGRFNGTEVDWRDGGYYWAGTEDTMGECAAVDMCFGQSGVEWYHGAERDFGFLVRPVNAPLPSNIVVAEAIDLGLPSGTKWANCNVGASKPEEYGDYYAWGETGTKLKYNDYTYLFTEEDEDYGIVPTSLGDDISGISGTKYDVARMKWGGNWRMPTRSDIEELFEYCTNEWTSLNGVYGRKFTSKKNGNSIFLPAAGCHDYYGLKDVDECGYYSSSMLYLFTEGPLPWYSLSISFSSNSACYDADSHHRANGQSVRPVISE